MKKLISTTALLLLSLLSGCDNGGYETTHEGAPGGTGGSAGAGGTGGNVGGPVDLNPGGNSGGTGGNTTSPGIPFLDLQSFEGCKTEAQLAGLVRTANGLQYPFTGLNENSELPKGEQPSCTNCEFIWGNPDKADQGPIKVSVYSNSGSIKYAAWLDKAKKNQVNVEFYTLLNQNGESKFANLQVLYQALYGKAATNQAVYDSPEWGKLVLDAWDCQFEATDNDCHLADLLTEHGKPDKVSLLNNLFSEALIGPEAFVNGSYCGHLQVVIKSRP